MATSISPTVMDMKMRRRTRERRSITSDSHPKPRRPVQDMAEISDTCKDWW